MTTSYDLEKMSPRMQLSGLVSTRHRNCTEVCNLQFNLASPFSHLMGADAIKQNIYEGRS